MKMLAILALAACTKTAAGSVDSGVDTSGACDGGCQPVQLCTTHYGGAIALDAIDVYVTTLEGGTVLACPKTAGSAQIVWGPGLQRTAGLAVDATNVYWTDTEVSGTVSACATTGCGSPTVLASMQSYAMSIAVDDTNAYWQSGAILSCAKTGCGGTPTILASNQGGQANSHGIAVDATNVYWSGSSGMVMKCAKTGCGDVPTPFATGSGTAHSLAVDATNVYWTVYGGGGVLTCPIGGCSGSPTVLGPIGGGDIAIDDTTVYWTTDDAIVACAKTGCGGLPQTLAMVYEPVAIAVDASGVYWSNNTGMVTRLPR